MPILARFFLRKGGIPRLHRLRDRHPTQLRIDLPEPSPCIRLKDMLRSSPMKTSERSRYRLSALVIVLLTSIAFASPTETEGNGSIGSERGTLGVVVFTKDGIVIAADSRASGEHSFDDHANKVFQLSDTSACTISGLVKDQRAFFTLVMGFDFPKAIEQYASRDHKLGYSEVELEAGMLGRRLSGELDTIPSLGQPSPLDDGETIASLIVVGYGKFVAGPGSPEHSLLAGLKLNINVRAAIYLTEGQTFVTYDAAEPTIIRSYRAVGDGPPFALFTDGNDRLMKPILEGKQRDFVIFTDRALTVDLRSIRANPSINKYLQRKEAGTLDSMNIEEAIALANALISENIRVAGRELGIGGQVDIATITLDKGFKWVSGHEPNKKVQDTQHSIR